MMPAAGSAYATVDNERGIFAVSTVDETQYMTMSVKVSRYHPCDILFFEDSIRKNIKDRIDAFAAKHE